VLFFNSAMAGFLIRYRLILCLQQCSIKVQRFDAPAHLAVKRKDYEDKHLLALMKAPMKSMSMLPSSTPIPCRQHLNCNQSGLQVINRLHESSYYRPRVNPKRHSSLYANESFMTVVNA
jgi:hypothetical protein